MDAKQSAAGPEQTSVRPLKSGESGQWDRFVRSRPDASFFHLSAWQGIFSKALHLNPHYLVAERAGAITGVLPLVHQSSLLFGSELSAAPFCVEGGPLAADEASRAALLVGAIALRDKLKARYLEFRSRKARHEGALVRRDLYATFRRAISLDDDANLKAIPRKQRAVVRKAIAGPLRSEVDADTGRFFRIYSESVRNLGTPVFPKRYFASVLRAFPGECDVIVVLDGDRPQAAVMNFYFRDTVLPYYGGGTHDARRTGANDFLYWEVIRRAARRGYTQFDFGRSKADTGAFAFKKNWGFEPEWLEYEYWPAPGEGIPEKNPNNPRYRVLIETWKRLPLPVANLIGPLVAPWLG